MVTTPFRVLDTNIGDRTIDAAAIAGLNAALNQSIAALGNSQATAALLALGTNIVTGADATKGVRLPSGPGSCYVINTVAAVLKLYPPVGGKVNGGTTDAALSMAASTACRVVAIDTLNWYTVPTVPA